MKTTGKNFDNDRANKAMLIRYCRMGIWACIFLLLPFNCSVTVGDETIIDELDPTLLLSSDSERIQQEQGVFDIQMLPYTDHQYFDMPVPIGNFTANFIASVKDGLFQTVPIPSEQLAQQLWKSRISPLAQSQTNDKADELKSVIEQVRSVKFQSQPPAQEQTDIASAAQPELDAGTIPSELHGQPVPAAGKTEIPDELLSDKTLEMVKRRLEDSNDGTDFLQLAEILFQSGKLVPAGLCYKKALASIPGDDTSPAGERAWILFQIGNCLKSDDPNTSRESYAELIRTQPDSPWAQIARARHGVLEWYQQEQPRRLIQQLKEPIQ